MTTTRELHTATLLTNEKVLVTGTFDLTLPAELYDPTTGTFTAFSNMTNARYEHAATLLNNGEVLITGGFNSSVALTTAENY
jgi:hypothetical protein